MEINMKIMTQDEYVFSETAIVHGQSKYIVIHALAAVVNSLAAAGGKCLGMEVQITIPEYAYSSKIHAIEKIIKESCTQQKIEELNVTGRKSGAAAYPMVVVNGVARAPKEEPWCLETGRAGQEIVLTKWIGMDGMLQIAAEKEQELRERFAPAFMKQILSYRKHLFALTEIEVAKAMGVSAVRQITEGGILAALWNLAKEAGTGLELDMKSLSVLQETIEVCEHYRLNPYQLTSVGSLLMVTDDGEALTDALRSHQIQAVVIGKMTDNNDKILHNGDEIRYLDRPAPDEILKIYCGGMHDGRDKKADITVSGKK